MYMDRDINSYESPIVVREKVFDGPTSTVLVKEDDYYPEDIDNPEYPVDFDNPHANELESFFDDMGLTPVIAKELVYIQRKNGELLRGSAVYASSDPFDTAVYMTLQASSLNGWSPVYIAELRMGEDLVRLTTNGQMREIRGIFSSSGMYDLINRIHFDIKSGNETFPDERDDPFLLLAHDISRINRRDFSRY